MRTTWIYLALLLILLPACSSVARDAPSTPTSPDLAAQQAQSAARYVCWGVWDLVIARDGSEYSIIPMRSAEAADYYWGYHINAVKLLEVSPGKNCINIWKIKLLPGGDLAVSISITHPYNDPCYTGFDVKGIIMFPSSQLISDPEIYENRYGKPPSTWFMRFASYRKGDAELMNPDGHTIIWAPDRQERQQWQFELEEGYPIFGYYKGRMASGEDIGVINGFKTYYTHQNRHMFQPGYTVTRTFIIRPPAEGPIQASYAVYAHWAPPSVYPVKNPAVDFPPEANSPIPYEFRIEQVGPIDPDAPDEVDAESILWHIKYWHFGIEQDAEGWRDLLNGSYGSGFIQLEQAFDICPDCYRTNKFHLYWEEFEDFLPGTLPVVFFLEIDPDGKMYNGCLATAYYIAWLDIEACDGEW